MTTDSTASTQPLAFRDRLNTTGVWSFTETMNAADAAAFAQRIEQLGYSTLWLPETVGRDPMAHIAWLGSQTSTLGFATGIASIFHRHPGFMKQSADTLAEQTGGRFLLGMGVSHRPMVADVRGLDYSKPLTTMREYIAAMDQAMYMAPPPAEPPLRVIAALGPKMLELAGDKTDGAHPYWTTPEHTATARDIMGPDPLLCVEQKIVLTSDKSAAHAAADIALKMYDSLPNYRNNWKRLGYTDDEIDQRAPRFVDAVVAWGDADAIQGRIDEHYEAGASHVCIQPLHPDGSTGVPHWEAYEALAPK